MPYSTKNADFLKQPLNHTLNRPWRGKKMVRRRERRGEVYRTDLSTSSSFEISLPHPFV